MLIFCIFHFFFFLGAFVAYGAADDLENTDADSRKDVNIVSRKPPQEYHPADKSAHRRRKGGEYESGRKFAGAAVSGRGNERYRIVRYHGKANRLKKQEEQIVADRGTADRQNRKERNGEIDERFHQRQKYEGNEFPPTANENFERVVVLVDFRDVFLHRGVFVAHDANFGKQRYDERNEFSAEPRKERYQNNEHGDAQVEPERDPGNNVEHLCCGVDRNEQGADRKHDDAERAEHERGDDEPYERDRGRHACGNALFMQIIDLKGLSARGKRRDTVVILPEVHRFQRGFKTEFARGYL